MRARPLARARARVLLIAAMLAGLAASAGWDAQALQPAAAPATGAAPAAIRIPAASTRLRSAVIREAQRAYGLDAPAARFAAQIHQESLWNPAAASRFAHGLAQFTPPTADWIAQAYPELRPAAPWDPHWSIRAMVRYMQHIEAELGGAGECDRWAFALSGYNGGPGWVRRDRRLAAAAGRDPQLWWDHVEHHTGRAGWARKENRDYVRRILLHLEPAYLQAGWPGEAACPWPAGAGMG